MTTQKLRSTSKIVVERIRNHVLGNLTVDGLGIHDEPNPKDQLQALVDGFHNWYGPYERKHTPNLQEAFNSWLDGLPSEFHYEFTNWGAREVLDRWFETTIYTDNAENPSVKFEDSNIMNLYKHLMRRELKNLMKQHSVDTKGLF